MGRTTETDRVRDRPQTRSIRSYFVSTSASLSASTSTPEPPTTIEQDTMGRVDRSEYSTTMVDDSLCVVMFRNPAPSAKIAAFDMDGTLIQVKSGARFPRHKDDWMPYDECVRHRLADLVQQGFKIVIMSNQAGINGHHRKLSEYQEKATNIASHYDVPMQFMFATKKDKFRKPLTGMWDHLVANTNADPESGEPVVIDYTLSFYVGDAAGRPAGWQPGAIKDHSDADRKLAFNLNLPFFTPEEYFFSQVPYQWTMPEYSAPAILRTLLDQAPTDASTTTHITPVALPATEMLVMVGSPASGKSTIAAWLAAEHGYEVVNQDTLKSLKYCIRAARAALEAGKSVVIDNTNPTAETRANYLAMAREFNVGARVAQLMMPVPMAEHLNIYRSLTSERGRIPTIAFRSFQSRFEAPDAEAEGWDEVICVPFVPRFATPELQRVALSWLE
ncbi:polynucleotide kinase 3 phosphatase-domain-containing protein [Blastocladiella britannica]|nr:polynucleotide kinase 3 phosphatase-domain-containing protein [Blastocladiella britannica]